MSASGYPTFFPPTAAGMPQGISQPYMYSGVMSLYVSFNCPNIWNSDYITFRLRRVDLGLNRDIFSSDPAAGNASPRLVRGMSWSRLWSGRSNLHQIFTVQHWHRMRSPHPRKHVAVVVSGMQ